MNSRAVVRLAILASISFSPVEAQTRLYELTDHSGQFGISACGVGDVDNDGQPDFAVGAPEVTDANCQGARGGRVLIYSGKTGSLIRTLDANNGSNPSNFGFSIASAGDVNGDGYPDIIVGDPLWSSLPQCGQGRVLIFSGLDGTVLRTLYGNAYPTGFELFGWSVANAGDTNGDGVPDVVVGAIEGSNSSGIQSGYARVFSGADGSVLSTFGGSFSQDKYGWSVSGAGDINHDGYADIIVGSPYSSYSGENGSVTVYSGRDGSPLLLYGDWDRGGTVGSLGDVDRDGYPDFFMQSINAVEIVSGRTGGSIYELAGSGKGAAAGDVNNDGWPDIAVFYQDGNAKVFSGESGGVLYEYSGIADYHGCVASAGDLNQDGKADLIVGHGSAGLARVYLSACPVPRYYCDAKMNSLGCIPAVSSSGVPSFSVGADDFLVTASNVRNHKSGFLFWSHDSDNRTMGGGGIVCVAFATRTKGQDSGGDSGVDNCSGSYSFHFTRAYLTAHGVHPGVFGTIYAQFWSRDPGYAPPYNIGLTNAVSFIVVP